MDKCDQASSQKRCKKSSKTYSHSVELEAPFEFILWPLLQTKSRNAIQRLRKRWGWHYIYKPRADLITRLSSQTGMTRQEVLLQLQRERNFLLKDEPWQPPRVK